MEWVVLTYRLPNEPSRHRVAVWRELRRVGAVSLQQATWAVPARRGFKEAVAKAIELIERADGEVLVFDAVPQGNEMAARLEAQFSAERDAEWHEFLAECAKFDAEIDKDQSLGRGYNVNQTPTSIIHYKGQTYPVVGQQTYPIFHDFLDQLLGMK